MQYIKKNKRRKATGFDELPSLLRKTRKYDDILLPLCNAVYVQDTIEK